MSHTRIYIAQIPPVGEQVWLDDEASHHLSVVLRKKVAEKLIVFAGTHEEALAEIVQIQHKKVQIHIQKIEKTSRESPLHAHLAQAICKGDKMDWLIQKATELGVSEITPLISAHIAYEYHAKRLIKKMQHWRAVSVHAVEQCGRTVLPKVNEAVSYMQFVEKHEQNIKWILTQTGQPLSHEPLKTKAITLLVGPEGGWSREELQFAHEKKWQALSLGPRILRAETAPLAILSVLQYCAGDF